MNKTTRLANAIWRHIDHSQKCGSITTKETIDSIVKIEMLAPMERVVYENTPSEWSKSVVVSNLVSITHKMTSSNVTKFLSSLERMGLVESRYVVERGRLKEWRKL